MEKSMDLIRNIFVGTVVLAACYGSWNLIEYEKVRHKSNKQDSMLNIAKTLAVQISGKRHVRMQYNNAESRFNEYKDDRDYRYIFLQLRKTLKAHKLDGFIRTLIFINEEKANLSKSGEFFVTVSTEPDQSFFFKTMIPGLAKKDLSLGGVIPSYNIDSKEWISAYQPIKWKGHIVAIIQIVERYYPATLKMIVSNYSDSIIALAAILFLAILIYLSWRRQSKIYKKAEYQALFYDQACREILTNIEQAYLSFGRTLKVDGIFSEYLTKYYSGLPSVNTNVFDYLFRDSTVNKQEVFRQRKLLEKMFVEGRGGWGNLSRYLIKTIKFESQNRKDKLILKYKGLFNQNDDLVRIVVMIKNDQEEKKTEIAKNQDSQNNEIRLTEAQSKEEQPLINWKQQWTINLFKKCIHSFYNTLLGNKEIDSLCKEINHTISSFQLSSLKNSTQPNSPMDLNAHFTRTNLPIFNINSFINSIIDESSSVFTGVGMKCEKLATFNPYLLVGVDQKKLKRAFKNIFLGFIGQLVPGSEISVVLRTESKNNVYQGGERVKLYLRGYQKGVLGVSKIGTWLSKNKLNPENMDEAKFSPATFFEIAGDLLKANNMELDWSNSSEIMVTFPLALPSSMIKEQIDVYLADYGDVQLKEAVCSYMSKELGLLKFKPYDSSNKDSFIKENKDGLKIVFTSIDSVPHDLLKRSLPNLRSVLITSSFNKLQKLDSVQKVQELKSIRGELSFLYRPKGSVVVRTVLDQIVSEYFSRLLKPNVEVNQGKDEAHKAGSEVHQGKVKIPPQAGSEVHQGKSVVHQGKTDTRQGKSKSI